MEQADLPDDEIRDAAQEALRIWQPRAESPMAGPEAAEAARILIRTLEGILTRRP